MGLPQLEKLYTKMKRNKSKVSSYKAYEIYSIDEIKSYLRLSIILSILAAIFVPICWNDENYFFSVSMAGSGIFCVIFSIYFFIRLITYKDNHIVFRMNQEGIYIEDEDKKVVNMTWDIVDSAFFDKYANDKGGKEYKLRIITTTGQDVSFKPDKYFGTINIFRLRKALRHHSGRPDFGKSCVPIFFVW